MQHFNSIELLDEKAALVTRFLNKAMEVGTHAGERARAAAKGRAGQGGAGRGEEQGWAPGVTHLWGMALPLQALARDPLWEAATQEDRAEANGLLEKYFMCRIYTSYVFFFRLALPGLSRRLRGSREGGPMPLPLPTP